MAADTMPKAIAYNLSPKVKRLLIILLLLSPVAYRLSPIAFGQIDRDFWFAVPFLDDAHDKSLDPGKGLICITSFSDTAHVTISQPAITDPKAAFYYPTTQLTLLPYSSTDVQVSNFKGELHRATYSSTVGHGVHVESDADISVYYAQINDNSELYAYKGTNALGTDFLVPMQRNKKNGYGYSTIEIVATEPNTKVTILAPVKTHQYGAYQPIELTLQPGEIYTLRAEDKNENQHLGGTIIHSDKPVAVNSTDDSVADLGQDLVGDQMVPATLSGSEYIAMRHRGKAEELVLYTYPNAPIRYTVNGGSEKTLAASSSEVINLSAYTDSVVYIHADTTFVAFQLTSADKELGGTILPQLSCTGSREVAVRKRFNSQQLNLLVKTKDTASFLINGAPVHLPFHPIPAAPHWSYCYIDGTTMFDANGVIRVRNTTAIFHLAILDYGGGTCSYGYFSGYNQMSITPLSAKTVYATGDTIYLSVEDPELYDDIVWTYPDGTTHAGAEQTVRVQSLSDAGYYRVSAASKDGCLLSRDYYELLIHVVTPECRYDTICLSELFPRDTAMLVDTTQLGYNTLKDTMEIVDYPCPSGVASVAYQTQAVVSSDQTYQLSFEYASSTYPAGIPKIQLLLNDSVHYEISSIFRTQFKTMQYTFQPPISGVLRIKMMATNAVGNNAKASLKNLNLQLWLPRRDTLFRHVDTCDIPCPHPLVVDSSIVVRCDSMGAYVWRNRFISLPGIYRDTIRSRDCDSLYYILSFDTVHCAPSTDTCYNVIAQRWNDVLGVMNSAYNGGFAFVTYKWYQNEVLMPDEKKSYIYVPSTFRQGDCYRAVMTTTNGQVVQSCPFCPEHIEYVNEGLEPAATKLIEDNHLVILRNNQRYNAQGHRL